MQNAEATPEGSRQATGDGLRPGRRIRPESRRLAISLVLSLLVHLPLLTLIFGGDGQGLPGFNFPWQARRAAVPDLRVVLMPSRETAAEPALTLLAEPVQPARAEPIVASAKATPSAPPAAVRERATVAIAMVADPKADPENAAPAAKVPAPVDRPADVAPVPAPEPTVIAVTRPEVATWVVPAATETPAPVIAEAPRVSSPVTVAPPLPDAGEATQARIEQEARERAAEQARLERERQEAQRQAEQKEAARQESAKQEAARQEAARQEAARQEAARQEASRQEAARQEASRQEAARQEASRQEAARQEASRQEAARQAAARQELARQEAAKISEAREAEAKREERLRALGRQLDAEAAKREAISRLPHSVSSARRGRLYGRSDPNEELAQYGEAFARKIQMNMTLDMVRAAARQPHINPVVITAVRSDGSVESVSFVLSSGVPALDEAIRRVVRSQEHYPAFPPALAREYDVIEIRRTWHFDVAVRLH